MIRLRRRIFLRNATWLGASTAGLTILSSACGLVPARTPAKIPRIGYLSPGTRESSVEWVDAFLDGLRELGYVEGQTIRIEWRFTAQGRENHFQELAAELVRLPVDVIVTDTSTPAATAAKQATTSIPIVAVNVAYPVQSGLVASLARPGANLTVSGALPPGMAAKRLGLLRDVVPGLARVAAFVDATNPTHYGVTWNEIRTAAEEAGVQVVRIDLRSAEDVEAAFEAAAVDRVDAVIDAQTPLLLSTRARVAELALLHRLPGTFNVRHYVAAGLLMSYSPNNPASSRRAAVYVDKVLKGIKPADLPVEQQAVFEFVVNLKTAQALGLTIPPDAAAQVTEWIQ